MITDKYLIEKHNFRKDKHLTWDCPCDNHGDLSIQKRRYAFRIRHAGHTHWLTIADKSQQQIDNLIYWLKFYGSRLWVSINVDSIDSTDKIIKKLHEYVAEGDPPYLLNYPTWKVSNKLSKDEYGLFQVASGEIAKRKVVQIHFPKKPRARRERQAHNASKQMFSNLLVVSRTN